MNIKKRSVWFLTLISLIAVITVFYASERPSPFDGIQLFANDDSDDIELVETSATNEESFVSTNNAFEEMRMEVQQKRSLLLEQLAIKVGTNDYTAEEKDGFYTEIEELTNIDSAEAMLELIIKSLGYDDAIVRLEENKALVDVVSTELTKQQANEIVFAVKQEWPTAFSVTVKPTGE